MHPAAAATARAQRARLQPGLRQPYRPAAAQASPEPFGTDWDGHHGSTEPMEVGTDEGIVALGYTESAGGKKLADTKVRYSWAVSLDGRQYHIDFTNSKTSGKKRIFVDGRVITEQKVYRSPTFQYSWPLGTHLLSIVPKQSEEATSVFSSFKNVYTDKVDCSFELRVNGLPFHSFKQHRRSSSFAEQQSGRAPSRPTPTAEEEYPFTTGQQEREYADMQRRAEQAAREMKRPDQAAPAQSQRRSQGGEEADFFNGGPARSLTPTRRRRTSEEQGNAGLRKGSENYANLADDRVSDSSEEEEDGDAPFFRYAGGANNSKRSPRSIASNAASALFGTKRSEAPSSPTAAAATRGTQGAGPWSSLDSSSQYAGNNQASQRPVASSSPNPWGDTEAFSGLPGGAAPRDANAGTAFGSLDGRKPDRPAGAGPAVDPWGASLPQDPWGRAAQATPQSPPTPSRTSQGLAAIRKTVPTKLLPWEPKSPSQVEKQGFLDAEGTAPLNAQETAAADDVDVEEQLAILASLEASKTETPVPASEPLLGGKMPSESPQPLPAQAPGTDAWSSQVGTTDPWGSQAPFASEPQVSSTSQWKPASPSTAPDPWGSAASTTVGSEQPPSPFLGVNPSSAGFSDPWGNATSPAEPGSPVFGAPGGDNAPLLSGSLDPWGSFPSKELDAGKQSSPLLSNSSDPWSSFGVASANGAASAPAPGVSSQADPWGGLPTASLGSAAQIDPWRASPSASHADQGADPWASLGAPAAAPYPDVSGLVMPAAEGYAKFEGDAASPSTASEGLADPWSAFGDGPAVATAVPAKTEGYGKLEEDSAAADPWQSLGSSTPGAAQSESFGGTAPHAPKERWPPW